MIDTQFDGPLCINEYAIMKGINSVVSMFEVLDQPVFPRNIMTSDYSGFFPVHDTNEMFNAFGRAQFKDCRISAYPPVRQDTQLIPNILLLDLDLDDKLVISNSRRAAP